MNREETKDFYKKLLAIVIPVASQNLISAAVSASDAVMLGMLDQNSMSSVSLATQVRFVLALFYAALTIGTTVLAAQYWGDGNIRMVEKVMGYAVRLSALISAMFFLAAFLFPSAIMRIFTSEPLLIRGGADYLHSVCWSYLLMAFSQIYLCIMKNSGRTARSTAYGITSMLLNIVLNWLFISALAPSPPQGIKGAARATVIATLVELILCLIENETTDILKLKLGDCLHPKSNIRRDFWRYTAPVLGNEIVWGCGVTMLSVIMGHLGTDAVAANSYASIVKNLVSCFCLGIGVGSGIIIGNVLGAGELEQAKDFGRKLCLLAAISGVVSGLIILVIGQILPVHLQNLSDSARGYLKFMMIVCSYYMIGKSVNSTLVGGIFCAGGDTKFGFLCDSIAMWAIIIPIGLTAAFVLRLSVPVVYFLLNLDEFVKIPAVCKHYVKYGWVKNLTRGKSK